LLLYTGSPKSVMCTSQNATVEETYNISTWQCTTSHSNTDVGDNCKVQMWSSPLPSLHTRFGTAQTMTCLGPWKIRWRAGTVGMVQLFRKSCAFLWNAELDMNNSTTLKSIHHYKKCKDCNRIFEKKYKTWTELPVTEDSINFRAHKFVFTRALLSLQTLHISQPQLHQIIVPATSCKSQLIIILIFFTYPRIP